MTMFLLLREMISFGFQATGNIPIPPKTIHGLKENGISLTKAGSYVLLLMCGDLPVMSLFPFIGTCLLKIEAMPTLATIPASTYLQFFPQKSSFRNFSSIILITFVSIGTGGIFIPAGGAAATAFLLGGSGLTGGRSAGETCGDYGGGGDIRAFFRHSGSL